MKPLIDSDVSSALCELIDPSIEILQVRPIGGGCISNAMQITLRSDRLGRRTWFAKSNAPSFLTNFQSERDGLIALATAESISVPKPIAVGSVAERSWLITEWVETQPQS
ncbi:MAG: fructosamine kinase family protein [Pirellulaceae bacterium]